MAIFQGGSNLPEDTFVNTWHFSNDATYAAHKEQVVVDLFNFYSVPGTGGSPLITFYSPYAVTQPWEIRTYDLSTPQPRVPTIYPQLGITPTTFDTHLPEEVAICLSFHGAPPVTARRRGRVYLGPFMNLVCTEATTTTPTRVSTVVTTQIVDSANGLMEADHGWSIYSPTTTTFVPVTGGWVDNAFDTQRRRGPDATSRVLWPVA